MTFPRIAIKQFVRFFLVLAVMAGLHHKAEARAQTGVLIRISPVESWINVGSTGSISLEVVGGVNVNAFDLTVRYDPAILNLDSYALGAYLSNLAEVKREIEPGFIRLVYTQLATPGASGDGILLNLVFLGLAPGVSEIVLESVAFSDSVGETVKPMPGSGIVYVQPAQDPTATAEPTDTQIPTDTPLPATDTPEPAPTQPPSETPLPTPTPAPTATATNTKSPVLAVTMTPVSAASRPASTPAALTVEHSGGTIRTDITGTGTVEAASTFEGIYPAVKTPVFESIRPGSPAPGSPEAGENRPSFFSPEVMERILWVVLIACIDLSILMLIALVNRRKKTHLGK